MNRYQALRSIPDERTHLICHIEELGELPGHVRRQGPWQVSGTGDIDRLKREYRLAVARDGSALVRCEVGVFQPER